MSPTSELTNEQLEHFASMVDAAMARRVPRQSWNRRIDLIIGIIAIVSLIFSAGFNWSKVQIVEQKLIEVARRQDDLDRDLRNVAAFGADRKSDILLIQQQLGRLQQDVTEIKQKVAR